MNINELIAIVKKRLFDNVQIENLVIEDKSFLHKKHNTNNPNKFHIKLKIKSETLRNMSRIESNKIIFKLIDEEMKNYIHSLQILIF